MLLKNKYYRLYMCWTRTKIEHSQLMISPPKTSQIIQQPLTPSVLEWAPLLTLKYKSPMKLLKKPMICLLKFFLRQVLFSSIDQLVDLLCTGITLTFNMINITVLNMVPLWICDSYIKKDLWFSNPFVQIWWGQP